MMSYYTPYSALQDLLRHYNANKSETDKLPRFPITDCGIPQLPC